MLNDRTLKALWVAFFVLITVVLVQNAFIFFALQSQGATGLPTQGQVNVCITGAAPFWPNPIECDPALTNNVYTCNLSEYISPQGLYRYSIDVISGNPNGTALFGTINSSGILEFNATLDQVGDYELRLNAATITTCSVQNSTRFNLTIASDIGPPILLQPIPNSTWQQDSTLVPYNMRNYWFDPAGAVEFLQYSVTGNQDIAITFQSTGEVTLVPRQGWCGTEAVRYTATSPWSNLSTQSNLVTLEVECRPDPGQDQQSSGSGGGGGGGGGAISRPRACTEDIFCYEWSECQYTSAITETGDPLELIIEGVRGSRIYLVENMPEDTDIFYRGHRYRECFDTNACSDRTMFYTDVCEYQPSCFDNIQNQNEEGVDCGGVCPPCRDAQEQEGVDEVGVIPPVERQEPVLLETESRVTLLLFYSVLALLLMIAVLLMLRSLIKSIIAKLVFKHKKTHRVILLDVNAKARILEALLSIESRIGKEPVLKLQEELSGVVREYFKAILGLDFEFTYEELVTQLQEQHVLDVLQDILQAFFNRSSELEFSGKPVTPNVLQALINEVRELVYQTAVLTQQDYKELDKDLTFRDIPEAVPQQDRFYLLLSQAQIAVQFGRIKSAQQLYALLQHLYQNAPEQMQALWYQDLHRFYLELEFAMRQDKSFLTRRGKK